MFISFDSDQYQNVDINWSLRMSIWFDSDQYQNVDINWSLRMFICLQEGGQDETGVCDRLPSTKSSTLPSTIISTMKIDDSSFLTLALICIENRLGLIFVSSAFWWACCKPKAWRNSIWGQLQKRRSPWIFQVRKNAQNHHFISLQTHQLFWWRRVLRLLRTGCRPRSLLAISPRGRISRLPGLQVFGERRRLSLSRLQARNSCEWNYLVDGYNLIIIIIHDNDAQLLAVFLWTLLHYQL